MTSVMTGCPGRRFLACVAGLKSQESQLFFVQQEIPMELPAAQKGTFFRENIFSLIKLGAIVSYGIGTLKMEF